MNFIAAMLRHFTILTAFILFGLCINAQLASPQQKDSITIDQFSSLPEKYYDKLSQKINSLNQQFDKKTEKYLQKIQRQELKLYRKLWKKDSVKARELFGDVTGRYNELQGKAAEQASRLGNFSKVYSSKLDSLSTAFKFLENNKLVSVELQSKLQSGLNSINGLQDKLNQTDQIRKYLKERKRFLTEQLEKFGLVKDLKQLNRHIFYYQQQIREYKEILDNPARLEEKLLGLLAGLPAFKDFFANNSQLGSLFNLPGSLNNSTASLAGLQTRASVMQDLQNRFGSTQAVQQVLQQNMQAAEDQLSQLKDKVNQYMPNGGSSDEELQDFKPNNQKTKSFFKRLEYGTNFQTQKATNFFPVTSDIGLSIGYKLGDKSVLGIGASYKMGMGRGWNHIRITHEGIGLRTYADVKLKGSFWISGGYEQNYKAGFNDFSQLKDRNGWQTSGLFGLSKIVSLKTKFFKKTKLQLLWDFLSYNQIPRTQNFIFRIGYNF